MEDNNDYVVIDIKTSGIDPDNDEIIKLSAIRVRDGKITEMYSSLVRPEKLLTKRIEYSTGITNDLLVDKLPIDKVLPEFLKFIGNDSLVGYDIILERNFINSALKKTKYVAEDGQRIEKLKNVKSEVISLSREKCLLVEYSWEHIIKFLKINMAGKEAESIFEVFEKLKAMPVRQLTKGFFDVLEACRITSNRTDIPVCVRQLCEKEYYSILRQISQADIDSLHDEELEVFNYSYVQEWEHERFEKKYLEYIDSIPKHQLEYRSIYNHTMGHNFKQLLED